MPRTSVTKEMVRLQKLVTELPAAECTLNVMFLYEDAPTRQWAREVSERVEGLSSQAAVRGTWWKIGDLGQPGVLAGAVSKAMRADMIVLAARKAEGLPLPIYVWINSWLPHRRQGRCALVALLGAPEKRNGQSGRVRQYLRAVARAGRLDLLVEERSTEFLPFSLEF